jgi:dephospho-CoA kinase
LPVRVPFVGLTGGLGAGKSTALAALARLGAATISSDAVVHELYDEPALREAVVARFGEQVAPGGIVDRSAIAQRVFASEQERRWLESQIWPLVGERVGRWLDEARAQVPPPPVAVVEVPLLFEAGLQDGYDATIAVIAGEELRRERAAGRGHALIDERDASQLPQQEKAAKATYVVSNDGSEEELERQLSAVIGMLRA